VTLTRPLAAADLSLRPATLDDAAFAADMWTAVRPSDPEDPVMTRYWWEHPWDDGKWERLIATRDGEPAGVCVQGHPAWEQMPERYARLQAELVPEARTPERLDALIGLAVDLAKADGALRATCWAWEDDPLKIAALTGRGFKEERRERFWELDLVARRETLAKMTDASRAHMREQGIEITTLDRVQDPERYQKLWRLSEEASQDTPRTVPWTPTPFRTFEAWLRNPGIREDRAWVARIGDDVVGISLLAYPPVRGVVVTEWTGTARSVRGKGVARALKCETLMQAIDLGVDRVRTDNDSQNKPILHINESMGYRIVGEMVQFIKDPLGGG
jgi:RimJ/RimL family protein N-acetyltransferase